MSDALAEDVLAIDNLMGAYAAASDSGFRPGEYHRLWADECEVTIGDTVFLVGKPAVLESLSSLAETISWAFHQFSREELLFNENRTEAYCTWSLLGLTTTLGPTGPVPTLATGRYRCVLTKADSCWRFKSLRSEIYNLSDWRNGWV